MFYLRKIATYPFECLPVERLYRKERKLATFKLGLKTASSPVRAGQRNRVHANTSAEHKSVWTRTWETIKKEALYLDHVIYELKFARVFSFKDPINPLNRYVPEFCITLVNRDFLRLPITFLMFYKFAFKGAKDLQTNIKNLGIYALRKGECERNGTAFHSSFNYNYFLNYGLLLWSPIALLFTGVKFVRDLYKGALVGYIPSYLAQGVVYMTPQMFKTESVVDTVRRLHNYFLKDSTFKSIDGVCSILRTVVILYAAAIDSIIMLRYVKDRYYAKPVSPEVTDPVLLALLKRRNNDKATLGKRMINLAVSLSTCLTLTSWEAIVSVTSLMPLSCAPAMCMMHQALHCGLVFYQTHYRYRLMEVRRGAVTFWGKVTTLEGAKKEKWIEKIIAGEVVLPSRKFLKAVQKMQGLRITQKRREAIANLIDQKTQRQLIKNMAVSSVAAKVYELICVQDVNKAEGYMNFFVEHFGFGKIWMNQVRDGFIPKGSAVVFIQDLLHIE